MKKLLGIMLLLPMLAFGKTIELTEKNTINFNQAFTGQYVSQKQVEAINLCAENMGSTINIVLYSPGGSISAGQLFFDTLKALPCKFDTITIFSASMAYQTVQNLGNRYILSSGTLMSHRAQISGLSGELGGDLNQYIKLLENSVRELEEVAASRAGISLEKYKEDIADELWMTAKEAVKLKHADEIVNVSCDKSLMGTRFQTFQTFFGNFLVEFSNCPIIVAPISVQSTRQTDKSYDFTGYFTNIKNRVEMSL